MHIYEEIWVRAMAVAYSEVVDRVKMYSTRGLVRDYSFDSCSKRNAVVLGTAMFVILSKGGEVGEAQEGMKTCQ